MKNILIIADGILAKNFLERLMSTKIANHKYVVVTYRDKTLPDMHKENFIFHSFDPTSYKKLYKIMYYDFHQAMILMSKKLDGLTTYENLRRASPKLQIFFMALWELDMSKLKDNYLNIIDARKIISSRFMDFFPDMPVIAQNVGLGEGEIMEVRVPVASPFAYRHLNTIEQKKWRIAMVYRNGTHVFPRAQMMIHPNDVLLLVGNPTKLLDIFNAIQEKPGQFPSPFGSNIYCIIDMKNMKDEDIKCLINDSLLLHSKISNKHLYFKIINPTSSKLFDKLKKLGNATISVSADFYNTKIFDVMPDDVVSLNIGITVLNTKTFERYKRELYNLKIPILKVGKWGFSNLKYSVVMGKDSAEIEKDSAVILDLSSQLDLELKLYQYDPDEQNKQIDLEEHFQSLSKLFGKEVQIHKSDEKNPIIQLRKRKDLLQFVPFFKKLSESNIFRIFSTDIDEHYSKLSNDYQLFIPAEIKQNDGDNKFKSN